MRINPDAAKTNFNNLGATAIDAMAAGYKAAAGGAGDVAIGTSATTLANNGSSVAIGNASKNTGTSAYTVGVGTNTVVNTSYGTALGTNATTTGLGAIALGGGTAGNPAKATQQGAIAIGGYDGANNAATSTANNAIAMGSGASASVDSAVAIGKGATATAGGTGSVALGSGSATAAAVGTASGTFNGVTYNYQGTAPTSTVSVGTSGAERTITNVAAGRVTSTSTDAINGSQLYAVSEAAKDAWLNAGGATTALGGGAGYDATTNIYSKPTYTTTNAAGTTVSTADNVGTALTNLNTYVNTGFKVQQSGTDKGTVTPGDKVSFVDGTNTTANVTAETAAGVTAVTFDVSNKSILNAGAVQYTTTNNATAANTIDNTTRTATTTLVGASGDTVNGVTLNNVAPGSISTGSKQAINGGQLYTTNKTVSDIIGGTGAGLNNDGTIKSPTFTVSGGDPSAATKTITVNDVGSALTNLTTAVNKPITFASNSGNTDQYLGSTLNIKGGATGATSNTNVKTVVTSAGNMEIQFADAPTFTGKVTSAGLDSSGMINANGGLTVASGQTVSMGGNQITNVASGGAIGSSSTNAANMSDVKAAAAAARTEVEAGTNIASVVKTEGANKQDVYTVNAKGTTVSKGSDAVTVTSSDKGSNVTDYAIDLSQATKDDIKAGVDAAGDIASKGLTFTGDSGTTGIKKLGDTVAVTGDTNITTVATSTGVQVKLNPNLDLGATGSVVMGETTVNSSGLTIANTDPTKAVSVTNSGISAGSQQITNVASGGPATSGGTNAVNTGDLYTATAAARTEVEAGTNIASVVKTEGANKQDVYTVNAKGTTVSKGSDAVTVTSSDKGSNVTDYAIDLSQATKDDIKAGVDAAGDIASKGLTFTGDSGTTGIKKLGDTVAVTGDTNITTVATSTGVQVKLNPNLDLGATGSVKAGGNVFDGTAMTVGGTNYTNVSQAINALDGAVSAGGSGWNLSVNNDPAQKVAPASTVTLNAGSNTTIVRDAADPNKVTIGMVDAPVFAGKVTAKGFDASGEKITNVGDGTVAAGSKDAVNGGQLYAVQQMIGGPVEPGTQPGTPGSGTASYGGGTYASDALAPATANPLLKTYNAAGQDVITTNNVATAINNMNQQGIKYFHTNLDGSPVKADATTTHDSSANAKASTAIGVNAKVDVGATDGLAIGSGATVGQNATNGIAIGKGAQALAPNSISIGTGNVVTGANSGALGDPNIVNAANSYAVGNNNTIAAGADNTFVLGNQVTIGAAASGAVALGNNSSVANAGGVALGQGSVAGAANTGTYTLGGVMDSQVAGSKGAATQVVSVGAPGAERQIQNVAPGVVSPTSTDAINGSQLYHVANQVSNMGAQLGNAIVNVDKDASAGTASAMAIAGLPQAYMPGKSMIAAGMSGYRGQGAFAVGVSTISDSGKWVIKGSVTSNTRGHVGATIGAGYQW